MIYVWFGLALTLGGSIVWFVHHELTNGVKGI